jgi:UDP-N-acetylmuramate dehydrogenase
VDGLVRDLESAGARVHRDAPLALLTTLRVGGPAAILTTVEDVTTLVRVVALSRTQGVPLMVLGRGSNLLVDDAGWPGIVLRLGAGFRGITIDGTVVRCGAAEPMPAVAVRTAQAGLPFEARARPAPRSHLLLGIAGLIADLNARITVQLPRDR